MTQQQLFQINYDCKDYKTETLYMVKEDIHKLYEVSQDEISTKTRILFTPPVNMIKQPIIHLGKTKDSLKQFTCEGFQGTYASEHVYLNTLCSYLTIFWNESIKSDEEDPIVFALDLNRLQRSLRARIGTQETPFAFMTNDYRLQKILGYEKFTDNQIFESQLQTIKQVDNENKKLVTSTGQVIDFPRVMYIRGFRYLNLICYSLSEHTHRENNEIRYILLRSYYDFQNGIYAELPGNYDVIFSCNSLVRGIKISFQDENYREIDLEGEPFTLQLFISKSARMIEKRAFTEAVEQQFKEQQAEKIKQEKEQKDKKDKEDKEKKDKEDKDKKDKQDKLQIKKDRLEQNKRDESLFKVLGKVIKLNKEYYQQQNLEMKDNWKNLLSAFELKNIQHEQVQKQLTDYTKLLSDKTDAQEKQLNINTGQLIAELKSIQQNQSKAITKSQESNNLYMHTETEKSNKIKDLLEQQITQNANVFLGLKNVIEKTTNQFINEILKHENINDLKDAEKTIAEKMEKQKDKLEEHKTHSIQALTQIKKINQDLTGECDLNISIIEQEYTNMQDISIMSDKNRFDMLSNIRNNPDVEEQHKIVQQYRTQQQEVLKSINKSSDVITTVQKQIKEFIQDQFVIPKFLSSVQDFDTPQNFTLVSGTGSHNLPLSATEID
ncbi:Hypothetical_protein [Hexamita inflata]|uniref:Hypothetical_protein n=1 Tax=Hexamita inflata TaxID=28002 RepID=A0AA86P9W8_9EUKA|nr:Hypothetical protein HINF_LOCUS21338 [Hexamita inflata]